MTKHRLAGPIRALKPRTLQPLTKRDKIAFVVFHSGTSISPGGGVTEPWAIFEVNLLRFAMINQRWLRPEG